MKPSEIIRELEYFQDLGMDTLVLPDGVQTLAALVSGNPPQKPQGMRTTVGAAVCPEAAVKPPGRKEAAVSQQPETPAPLVTPSVPRELPQPEKPVGLPAVAATPSPNVADKPEASRSEPTRSEPAKPLLIPLLSQQLKTGKGAEAPFTMFDAIGVDPAEDSLERIREDIGDCKRCRLCPGRTKIVFGSGNERAQLVFVGEGPGEDEDLSGLPFVGRAGQLLTRMIEGTAEKEGIPIKRNDVYICNVVKCRPPKNRKPEADEMEICGQFLFRQLSVLKPKAICVLGATAAQALLRTKEKMGDLRGKWQSWREIPVMVTYHPSYLLRAYSPEAKRLTWEDLKMVLHRVYDDPTALPQREK